MDGYKLEKISNTHCNIYFLKKVTRRSGLIETDVGDKIYSTKFNNAINLIAHRKTQDDFGDKNISLKEYLSSFYKNWNVIYNENC